MNILLNSNLHIQKAAINTKIENETLSESYVLYNRTLSLSEDYSRIGIVVFNDFTLTDAINNVILSAYLTNKYNSEVILFVSKKSKFFHVYSLFTNIFTKIVKCLWFVELQSEIKISGCTKIIYNKILYYIGDLNIHLRHGISLDVETLLFDYANVYTSDSYYTLSTNGMDITIEKIKKLQKFNPNCKFVFLEDTLKKLNDNLIQICHSNAYINVGNNLLLDNLAPFLGVKLIQIDTNFYRNNLFRFSASIIRGRLKAATIRQERRKKYDNRA